MKLKAEITVSDNATWQEIEDAKLSASWRVITGREALMQKTDLTNKCGSCKYFKLMSSYKKGGTQSMGYCKLNHNSYHPRTQPKCKKYEKEG